MNEMDPSTDIRSHVLKLRRLGIETHQETMIYMRQDCHVCRSEGFSAQARIAVRARGRSIVATLGRITSELLAPGEASLSESAWRLLAVTDGDEVHVAHAPPVESLGHVRAKIYGRQLDETAMLGIVGDIVAGRYADVHLAAFITACSGQRLGQNEVLALTRAMVAAGRRLEWGNRLVADKHCVGGLPGNRTTPIVVAIAATCGLTIPKTSSRAITSPAGTADTMETLAPVDLDVTAMRRVVEKEGGCIVWGGAVDLSPADDILIRIERALDLDSEGQLVASVLSKKIAVGATHVILDLPVGPTAKVRSDDDADRLSVVLGETALAAGLSVRILRTDGTQPVGRGIGPALEARDVVSVLQNAADAPRDLLRRSVALAGHLLELLGRAPGGTGIDMAEKSILDGSAWRKLQAICVAQGGLREPPTAAYLHPIEASTRGRVVEIDNRLLARIAKFAGAPGAKAAGVLLHAAVGQRVDVNEPLYTIHAESRGELEYALDYITAHRDAVRVASDR
ncbi:MAG TPA: thymidine phosphorylase family protein [Alphaproteobacteria bacterium]|nr:thymidine phosphorylase family protein [Alphaproteobacteria bacterium]